VETTDRWFPVRQGLIILLRPRFLVPAVMPYTTQVPSPVDRTTSTSCSAHPEVVCEGWVLKKRRKKMQGAQAIKYHCLVVPTLCQASRADILHFTNPVYSLILSDPRILHGTKLISLKLQSPLPLVAKTSISILPQHCST
jgi:hypothetical protein